MYSGFEHLTLNLELLNLQLFVAISQLQIICYKNFATKSWQVTAEGMVSS
jgi:hypothetical protein